MSSKAKKRPRADADDSRADCPFSITMISAPSNDDRDQTAKKRKRNGDDDTSSATPAKREFIQVSPFVPKGKFKSNQSMNLAYTLDPQKRWLEMTRYNSFVLNGTKYFNDEFVYVANDTTIELQKAAGTSSAEPKLKSTDYWVARILEVRASDEHHVYARIYWMYSPDELPANTIVDGKKNISGRQPYHGQNELVASNHMDVINVVTVSSKAIVHQWVESEDEEVQDALYWRQAYNCLTGQISAADTTCICKTPANPDKTLIGCTSAKCGTWLHHECLLDEVLSKVFERLGRDKPHKGKDTGDSVARPLTATENGQDDHESTRRKAGLNGNAMGTPASQTLTPTPGPPNSKLRSSAAKASSGKRGRPKKGVEEKPYEGLFAAKLKMNEGPMVWEITDLRTNVTGGDRTWTERAACLICGTLID